MIDSADNLKNTRIAVMQPYFLPYLGYFQLIAAADVFVFYDDVQFIKKGWLRRNRIENNGLEKLISVPCIGASQNRLISEVVVDTGNKAFTSMPALIQRAYSHCPFFLEIFPLIQQIFNTVRNITIAKFNATGIQTLMDYLDLDTPVHFSSEISPQTRGLTRVERLAKITNQLEGDVYMNPPNGTSLYSQREFAEFDLLLEFHEPQISPEIGSLSIIHALMHFGKERMKNEILSR